MGEKNYIVYEPTPLGRGIIVAVFVKEQEAKFFANSSVKELKVLPVKVNGDTSIHRYNELMGE